MPRDQVLTRPTRRPQRDRLLTVTDQGPQPGPVGAHGVGEHEGVEPVVLVSGRAVGRTASTISRELRRNTLPHDLGYDGDLAHARARERARRPRRSRLIDDPQLRAVVQAKLELEWSPEQIAAHLRQEFSDQPSWYVCHETIYQALYQGGRGGLSRTLTRRLRTGRPLRIAAAIARTPRPSRLSVAIR